VPPFLFYLVLHFVSLVCQVCVILILTVGVLTQTQICELKTHSILLPLNAFKTANSGTSVITVTDPSHARSSSDTVRFYDVIGFDGITATNINRSAGYTITKVDDNTYTFTVATDTATTGNLKGGGGRAYAGPTTITP